MKSTRHPNFELSNHLTSTQDIFGQKVTLAISFLLFISFSSLYLIFPPDLASQPWDSLQYGYSAEVDGIRSIQGNHPLGHVIFFTAFTIAKQLGYDGRALTVFQVTNGVLGGLIIAIFFIVLVALVKVRMQYALGFSLLMGMSYSFRFFAGTGDIYHFSMLFFLLTLASLIYEVTLKNRSFPILSGILAGSSILFHQLNIVILPVGLALILLTPSAGDQVKNSKIKQLAVFIGATSAVAVLGYLLLGFIATSSFSLSRVVGWMHGYFGDPTYGRYLSTGSLATAWTTVSQLVMFPTQNTPGFLSSAIVAILIVMMFLGLWSNQALDERKRVVMKASALECLITWPLILWWEPQNPKFWLLTLIPWIILLALSFEAVEISIRNRFPRFGNILGYTAKILPFMFGVILLSTDIQNNTGRPDNSTFRDAMNVWLSNSGPNDVLITAGDLIPHLMYWGKRPNTIYLYRSLQASQTSADDFYDLREKIDQALCTHHTVLITPAASEYVPDEDLSLVGISREELRSFLDELAHQGKLVFWYRDVFDDRLLPVYALRQSLACSDQKGVLDMN